jgi:hypothetical protein
MFDEMMLTIKAFAALFKRASRMPWTILLPLCVIGLVWAGLRHIVPTEREAFMAAFVVAFALRLAMKADGTIQSLTSQVSNRTALIVALMLGPMALTALIWLGDPVWCQRFLSLYFLIMASLYLLDVIDGRHAMRHHFQPGPRRRTDPTLSRVMAICYLALVLLNETLIREASLLVWLLYFGLLPILLNRLLLAVTRTVDQARARGIDLL